MNTANFSLNPLAVLKSFNRAANTYDDVAVLQREVGKRLLERLDSIRLDPKNILDLGCGTGLTTKQLAKRFKSAQITAIDFADDMIKQAKKNQSWFSKIKFQTANAEQLPFADHSFDFVFSNMVVHWSNDLIKLFSEVNRVLKPDGLFLFSTVGPDTLKELRACWAKIDELPHVHIFIDMHDIGDTLMRAQFKDPVMDVENITLTYADVYQLIRDLKYSGTHNLMVNRHKGLTGKKSFKKLIQNYENFRNQNNLLPATYEVIYGHAWGAIQNKSGEIKIPISTIGRAK